MLWVKLPLPLDELPARGVAASDPYPHLQSRWKASDKQWYWSVHRLDEVPDVALALDLSLPFQPEGGPMAIPGAEPEA